MPAPFDSAHNSLELIVYACPTGPLGDSLNTFFVRSRDEIGPNSAHGYMPHCTLTGFFHDSEASVLFYVDALQAALSANRLEGLESLVAIPAMRFDPEFHYLELVSPWLQKLTLCFAKFAADSPTRTDSLRCKDWLHVSLAYGFGPEQAGELRSLAQKLIDIESPVGWDLRLYERGPDGNWRTHYSAPICVPAG